MSKEAVVFILDASPSMNQPYPVSSSAMDPAAEKDLFFTGTTTTRLLCAQRCICQMIAELMMQSKTNEVGVIVCKSRTTRHHRIGPGVDLDEEEQDEDVFENLQSLTFGNGDITKPSVDLLRRIQEVESVSEEDAEDMPRGSWMDAVALAADMMEKRKMHKFRRRIVLVTDAAYVISVDMGETRDVVGILRELDVTFQVVGLEFEHSGMFGEPTQGSMDPGDGRGNEPDPIDEDTTSKTVDSDDENPDGGGGEQDGNDADEEGEQGLVVYNKKADREKLLLDIARATNGVVVAASTLQQVLEASLGKKVQRATPKYFDLRVAPGLHLRAASKLLMKKDDKATLKKEAVLLEEDGNVMKNDLGQEMMDEIASISQYVDKEQRDDVVPEDEQVTAIRYGSSLLPMGINDYKAIGAATKADEVNITFLAVSKADRIPKHFLVGPPYLIMGGESQKACGLIAALAQALHRTDKVAIGTFGKTKNRSDPILGALFPFITENPEIPLHLVFLRIPYNIDATFIGKEGFADIVAQQTERQRKSCDDLIDALMLPDGVLESGTVPNPYLRSWNQNIIHRALDPSAPLVSVRQSGTSDPMAPARNVQAVKNFQDAFPLVKAAAPEPKKQEGKKGRRALTYADYLEAEGGN